MTAGTVRTPVVFESGDVVDFVGGDMLGEQGTVQTWRYASLSYHGHQPDDPRVYMVLIHGHAFPVPCDASEIRRVDE